MKRFLAITALALCVVSTSAMADTRGDFISHPDAYAALSVNKGLPNGQVITFDIPVHASLLGANSGAVPVSSYGRPLATSIAYARPVAGANYGGVGGMSLGMAHSPYAR